MAATTLSLPDELYRRMKLRREIKWSETARRHLMKLMSRLEESIPAERFLDPCEIRMDVNIISWKSGGA